MTTNITDIAKNLLEAIDADIKHRAGMKEGVALLHDEIMKALQKEQEKGSEDGQGQGQEEVEDGGVSN